MLGQVGDKWIGRLQQHVAKDLRTNGWSQTEIAEVLGSTQSTISRQMQKPPIRLNASADEATIDGWGNELSQALSTLGPGCHVLRQRLIVEFQLNGNNTLRFDKTLTGLDLDAGQDVRLSKCPPLQPLGGGYRCWSFCGRMLLYHRLQDKS